MENIRLCLTVMLMISFTLCIRGQQTTPLQQNEVARVFEPLRIGDRVPNGVKLENLRNYPARSVELADFKGKLVIIDFWNKWCIPCISAFPKMEKLQQRFGDSIQILLVTTDTDEELKSLFERSEIVKNTKLPIVTSDKILKKLFPHSSVPYHVWIDKEGFVRYTLAAYNTNLESIQKFLSTGEVSLTLKHDKFDHALKFGPLFNQIVGPNYNQMKQVQAYTLFTKMNLYNNGAMQVVDTASKRMLNFPILGLFQTAYGLVHPQSPIQSDGLLARVTNAMKVSIITKSPENKDKYYYPDQNSIDYGKWMSENIYCYETVFEPSIMKLPAERRAKVQDSLVIRDLDRFFSVKSSIEYKMEKCLVITSTGGSHLFRTKGGEPLQERTKENIIRIRNYSVSSMIAIINKYFMKFPGEIPVIDETGYSGTIDVDFRVGDRSIEELDKDLRMHGLTIKVEDRMIRCLTLKEV
ncbi:TlpA disulfide reductase family protein [Chitinophaga sp. XS-30]|uniref:TlpA family protein disulfide reductase n=1 Tax=Chitinophaga sp. XS-30 TaxID=2604421 RepID=UPI0011DCB392|nr:TlpA disulfide reductase family protein [Chitinophaga sp. XS-30]QEH43184.1 TlpA family protein disulfide reductase [Chitinophaga sp. XS-30]